MVGTQQADQEAPERRLAAAVRPDERDPLASRSVEGDIADHGVAAVVAEPDGRGVRTRTSPAGAGDRVGRSASSPGSQMPAARIASRGSSPGPRPAIRRRSVGRRARAPGRRRPAARPHRPGARSARRSQSARRGWRERRHERRRARRGRGWRSARRGRAARAAAPGHRPARGAAAGHPTAGAMRCRSVPPRPTSASASGTRACIASRGQPRFSRPNATSSSTRSITSCVDGSWSTRPTLAATPTGPRSRTSSLVELAASRRRSPGSGRGSDPAIASASVLLPDPDGPTMSRTDPGSRSRSTPASAGPIGPGIGDRRGPWCGAAIARQSGNPSRTPACLRARCRATEPPATITTAEIAMKMPRTSLDDRVDVRVVERPSRGSMQPRRSPRPPRRAPETSTTGRA